MDESGPNKRPEWAVLGRIIRAQGLNGAVRVLPHGITPKISEQLVGKAVCLHSPRESGAERWSTLERERWHKAIWIVELSDCRTRDDAETLVGWDICLPENERPSLPPGEFYQDQLVGLAVVDAETGTNFGEVVALRPAPAADLLEVLRSEGGRFVIPLVKAIIIEVDLAAGKIRVKLPEGMTEISP